MLKFRCQHCGQRIAVPARHLGKLVTCAECGAQTHPLARQIEEARPAPAVPLPVASVASPPADARTPFGSSGPTGCANCGIPVGRLQASQQWEGERVCGACYHVLSAESSLIVAAEAPPAATRVRVVDNPTRPITPQIPAVAGLREQVARGLVVFIVGVVALYGALTLLRDLAGLIAVTAVAVLALLALYAVFRGGLARRFRNQPTPDDAALVAVRR